MTKNLKYNMVGKIAILSSCIIMLLAGCNNTKDVCKDTVEIKPIVIETEEYEKRQNYYTNIDFVDEGYLMKIAQYKGGDLKDRIYTILITLNKAQEVDESNMQNKYVTSAIQDVVLYELYHINGLTSCDFEEIVSDEITIEAMKIVKCEKLGMNYN